MKHWVVFVGSENGVERYEVQGGLPHVAVYRAMCEFEKRHGASSSTWRIAVEQGRRK